MKANLLGMDMNDIDREYNVVNDSGFLLAVPKSQGDIRDITKALEYKRLNVIKDMTGDAAQYIDALASRERLVDRDTTVWTSRNGVFVLIDKETQSAALDRFGQPVMVSQAEIPEMAKYMTELQRSYDMETFKETRRYGGATAFDVSKPFVDQYGQPVTAGEVE